MSETRTDWARWSSPAHDARLPGDPPQFFTRLPAEPIADDRSAPNTPAVAARKPWCKLMHLNVWCLALCPRNSSTPGVASRVSVTTCCFIGRQRYSSGKASIWTAVRLATGSGAPVSLLLQVINHVRAHLRCVDRSFVDETRAPVLEPDLKRTESCFFRAVVTDDRGHGGVGLTGSLLGGNQQCR